MATDEPPQQGRRRVAVVFNPASGGLRNGTARHRREELRSVLTVRGIDVLWYETGAADPGEGCARQAFADGVDLLLAAGGDGTVRACARALAGTGLPLAIVPNGTGNMVAASLGLPTTVADAVDVALHGTRRRMDLGGCGSDQFIFVASIGMGAAVIRDARPALKASTGMLAYLLSAVRHLWYPADTFRISVDGTTVVRRCHGVLVGNLGQMMTRRSFETALDDGRLEVVALRIRPFLDWFRPHRSLQPPPVDWHQGHRIEIVCGRLQPVETDGDLTASAKHLSIEVLPQALTVCVPTVEPLHIPMRTLLARVLRDAFAVARGSVSRSAPQHERWSY